MRVGFGRRGGSIPPTVTIHTPNTHSQVQTDDIFGGGPVGFGLFLPPNRGGWTEDLVFKGPGVRNIPGSEQEPWQLAGRYSITNIHQKG